ncbi:MAG: chromate transporter [Clostridia bacterium]|nr:chromate transporter [Clostridia bacterium]
MNIFLLLFLEFFKVGLFAIGGGPATIPFLSELGEKYGWYTQEKLTTIIAISETTPGPVGINMATYVGYSTGTQVYGLWGGIVGGILATLALVAPSIIIICIISKFLASFRNNKIVNDAFYGIRPAVTALVACAVISLIKESIFTGADGGFEFNLFSTLLFAAIFVLLQFKKLKKLHPVFWFVGAAVLGIVFKL